MRRGVSRVLLVSIIPNDPSFGFRSGGRLKMCRLKALMKFACSTALTLSLTRMCLRRLKSSLRNIGMRCQPSVRVRPPNTYPPPALIPARAFGSANAALLNIGSVTGMNFPSADDLVHGPALRQELLALADRQFIDVAEHQGLRNVLVAEGFLSLQVERILRRSAAMQRGKERQGAVGVGEGLGP